MQPKDKNEDFGPAFRLAVDHMTLVMRHLGLNLDNENFKGTPARFIKYLQEYINPSLEGDVPAILKVDFSNGGEAYKGIIAQTDIPFRTVCPHHLLPVVGKAHVGYIPTQRMVGLSKLTRLVEVAGTIVPQMQETITDYIADTLMEYLECRGAICVISAEHGCMFGRGVCTLATPTITSSVRGAFRDEPSARAEFMELLKLSHVRRG